MKTKICKILEMKECSHVDLYLGNSFCRFDSINDAFGNLIDKLLRKLAGWKEKNLSLFGRTTMVKSVEIAVPTYVMQTFFLTKNMCDKLDGMVRKFWWG